MNDRPPPPARALGVVLILIGLCACASGRDSLVATTDGGGSQESKAAIAVIDAPALADPGRAILVGAAGASLGAAADPLALDDLLYYGGDASLPGGPRITPATLGSLAGASPLGAANAALVPGGAAGAAALGSIDQLSGAALALTNPAPAAATATTSPTVQSLAPGLTAPAPAAEAAVAAVATRLSAPGETVQTTANALATHPAALGSVAGPSGVAGASNPVAGAVIAVRKLVAIPPNPPPLVGH